MAVGANPLSTTPRDPFGGFFLGSDTKYNPTEYNKFNYQNQSGYGGYSSDLGNSARGNLQQMMSGQLSDSSQSLLDQQFNKNLAKVRQGGYGMPLGAQMGLEAQSATQNALSASQLAEQQRNFALTQSLGYEQLGQQDKQYGYTKSAEDWARMNSANQMENTNSQNWEQKQREQMMANNGYKGGLFNDIANVGRQAVVNTIGGAIGGVGSNIINSFVNPRQQSGMGGDYLGGGGGYGSLGSEGGYQIQMPSGNASLQTDFSLPSNPITPFLGIDTGNMGNANSFTNNFMNSRGFKIGG